MKKIIITGASGFVAYHFLSFLNSIQEKCDVLGLDIKLSDDIKNYSFKSINLHFEKINLLDFPLLESIIISYKPTHIVHLAAFSSVSKSWNDPASSFINNTSVFLNICEIIRNNNIKCRFLSVGSSEVYGNVPKENIPIKETADVNPISPYAIARVSQEMLSKCYVSAYNLDIILTRSFNHIGPRQQDNFVIPSFVKQIIEKSKKSEIVQLLTGDITVIRDFLDVRDVVKAYYLLMEKGISGEVYNVCSGVGYSLKEIINNLSNLLSVKLNIEMDKEKIRPSDNKIIIGDNSKINNLCGWKPQISLTESLNDIIFYWKKELKLL